MPNSVEAAYARYQRLTRILEHSRRRALADPRAQYNVELGLVEPGLKGQQAEAAIEAVFDELTGLLNHVCILDMAAAFEWQFRAWLGTAVGEARKVVERRYNKQTPLYMSRRSLVREVATFEGLAEIENVLIHHLNEQAAEALKLIRSNRNKYSHGIDTSIPPTITVQDAKETLDATSAVILSRDD